MQHLHPVSSNEQKSSMLLFSLLSFYFKKEKKVLLHISLPRGKGEDCGVDQASFKAKVLPCREANDRKAKLLKFEQSVLNFF